MTTTPSAEQSSAGATTDPSTRTVPSTAAKGDGAEVTERVAATPVRRSSPTRASRSTSDPGFDPEAASGDSGVAAPTERRLLGYRRQRFEARKVRRLLRHVDPWSMFKLSLLLSLCMWLILMIAAVIMWTVARNAGTIASIENFVNSSLSLQDWSLDGDFIFRQFGLITLLLSLGFTAAIVVASLVFNLVSDIIGGVWVSVIEEETARPVVESKPSGRVG